MLSGFLGTVYSSSSLTVRGSLSLVAQAIDHFRYLSLGAKLDYYYIEIGLLYRDFDPSGSHQLPIAAEEWWRPMLADTPHLTIFRDHILVRQIENF